MKTANARFARSISGLKSHLKNVAVHPDQRTSIFNKIAEGRGVIKFSDAKEAHRFLDQLDREIHEFNTFMAIHNRLPLGMRFQASEQRLGHLQNDLVGLESQKTFKPEELFIRKAATEQKIMFLQDLLEKDKQAAERSRRKQS